MRKYIIRELQDPNSTRQGTVIEAASLAGAKRMATRMQLFRGTCMVVERANYDGTRTDVPLAIKQHGKWRDYE